MAGIRNMFRRSKAVPAAGDPPATPQAPAAEPMNPELDQTLKSFQRSMEEREEKESKKQEGQALLERWKERGSEAPGEENPQVPAKGGQLPLWPEKARAAPNVILRSALFPATNKRRWVDNELIASVDGVEIRFKGQTHTQKHFDTLAEVFHLVRNHPESKECFFTAYSFLKAQKLQLGSSSYQQLDDELMDLLQPVNITWNGKTYKGGLIYRVKKDEATKRYKVMVDPDIAKLFAPNEYTLIDWEQRRQLGRNSLAKSVHNHIISHAAMFAYSLEKWRELTGSTEDLKQYRRRFKRVLALLEEKGIIQSGYIEPETDLVHIHRTPSPAQQKHIAKPKKGRKSQRG